MVFLFLIAATLAVLGYMSSDKRGKRLTQVTRERKKLADSSDLRNPVIEKMMKRYDSPPSGERPKTVAKQFLSQTAQLTKGITGQETDAEEALKDTRAVFEKIQSDRGLAVEANSLHDQLAQAMAQLQEKDRLLAAKQDELAAKDQHVKTITDKMQGEIAALQEQVSTLDKRLGERHGTYESDLETASEEWQRRRDSLDKEIAIRNQEITELRAANRDLRTLVERLKDQLIIATRGKTKGPQVGRQPDGKILKVLSEENLCYIDLGTKDRVSPGLTFTIYPPTGIPEDAKGKGTLVIANVAENTSECRIKDTDRGDPIVAGDLVANLAFDPTRTYIFVVEGQFDLYGTGQATYQGADQAKALITRHGGKIAEEVSIDTDFVVLGVQPPQPPKPSEVARANDWKIYQEQLAIANRYNKIKQLAESMRIPVLNTNKFLAYIGSIPVRSGG
jgi:hypothetical protein